LKEDEVLKKRAIELKETEGLLRLSGGDARKLLNLLELVTDTFADDPLVVTDEAVMQVAQRRVALYDKTGELHYDIISAFIKSIRGSDPNAAVYWLARMIEGGEDVKFIARRLVILASEDIGIANPNALLIATSCFQAVTLIGYPEADIILSQAVVYLATSVKSNASYKAIKTAKSFVRDKGDLPVPLHLRNAPTKLMKNQGYGADYQYSHDYAGNFSAQEYLPEAIQGTAFYEPGNNQRENELRNYLRKLWGDKYGY
jgi:putative ATPase